MSNTKQAIAPVQSEIQSLENALKSFGLSEYKVYADQARKGKYFLKDDKGNSITGYWDYVRLNHFIMGYGKAWNKHDIKCMVNTRHTAAPWRFQRHDFGRYYGNIIGSYGIGENGFENTRTITIQLKNAGEEENEANAKLIAAAPELLESLRLILLSMAIDVSSTGEFYGEHIKRAIATIKKATE